MAEGLAELMIYQQTCRQWWGGVIGTHGYCETWMDEGLANYFGHRLMDCAKGRNNQMIVWPKELSWLPQIRRDNYRFGNLYATLDRGDAARPSRSCRCLFMSATSPLWWATAAPKSLA